MIQKKLKHLWEELYAGQDIELLEDFFTELEDHKKTNSSLPKQEAGWYKDAVIYSLYVDLFNTDFKGLTEKLAYISELGVSCLWLLPILDSPMKDAGFDIRNYDRIRPDLLGLSNDATLEEQRKLFKIFLDEAHAHGLRVIFDIAMNHTSMEHPWFQESRKGADNPFREYYIWNKDTNRYKETRLLFKGMCPSNWEKDGDCYFFHRFFEFQPDLNYRNPKVLLEMSKNLLFWLSQGVDGFRADAIPYLWKEEGTDCENLPETHTIVKFFRAVTDYARPDTLLLAEACQPPKEVVKYFGNGDECHAGYHFPLMPQIFIALATQNRKVVFDVLSSDVTPEIPDEAQWFTFLRVHDELTLEMVTQEERDIINSFYLKDPRWLFREGEGVASRLSELLDKIPERIALAYSIMLTLPGTPLVYYGDEFGRTNDEAYYKNMKKETGYNDSRYFVRGSINWDDVHEKLSNKNSFEAQINKYIRNMLHIRKQEIALRRGKMEEIAIKTFTKATIEHILAYTRTYKNEQIIVLQNLSDKITGCTFPEGFEGTYRDLLSGRSYSASEAMRLNAWETLWLKK